MAKDGDANFLEFLQGQACCRRGLSRQNKSTTILPADIASELTLLIERLKMEGAAWVAHILNLVIETPVFLPVVIRRYAICAISSAFVDEIILIEPYTVDAAFRHDLFLLWTLTHFHLCTDVTVDNTLPMAEYMQQALRRVRALLHNTIRACEQNTTQ